MPGEQIEGVPTGLVAFWNNTVANIPAGWREQTDARGRYIVGLPASGTLAGTSGTALSNTESRPVGQHTHVMVTDDGAIGAPGSIASTTQTTSQTNVNTDPAGSVAGTPAPYIQYVCIQKS